LSVSYIPFKLIRFYTFPFTAPSTPALFSFDLVQVTEQQVELRWSDLITFNSLDLSSYEIFLQYQKMSNGKSGYEEDGCRAPEEKKRTKYQKNLRKVVKVPISLSSRGVTVAGLFPGSIYSFTLQASRPAGPSWSLGQTQVAYMSESADNFPHVSVTVDSQQILLIDAILKYLCFLTFRTLSTSEYHH